MSKAIRVTAGVVCALLAVGLFCTFAVIVMGVSK